MLLAQQLQEEEGRRPRRAAAQAATQNIRQVRKCPGAPRRPPITPTKNWLLPWKSALSSMILMVYPDRSIVEGLSLAEVVINSWQKMLFGGGYLLQATPKWSNLL